MYIHTFAVRNYLIHGDSTINLSPITVLVGPNGGGKSALFDAMLNFSMLSRGAIGRAFGSYPFSFAATRFRGAPPTDRIRFDVTLSEHRDSAERLEYSIDYIQEGAADLGKPVFRIYTETLRTNIGRSILFERGAASSSPLRNALPYIADDRGIFAAVTASRLQGREDVGYPLVNHCASEISRFNRFRLNPYNLAGAGRMPDLSSPTALVPRILHEGEDLASCLFWMEETGSAAMPVICDRVRGLLPSFEKFEFSTLGADRVGFSMVFNDGRGTIPAVRMSAGSLLFVGLMVLTMSPNRPPLMLIEEPENGLTPDALKAFYGAIHELACRPPSEKPSQVMISSHSPFVICEAWNGNNRDFINQVQVEGGRSRIRSFSEALEDFGGTLQRGGELGLRHAECVMVGHF